MFLKGPLMAHGYGCEEVASQPLWGEERQATYTSNYALRTIPGLREMEPTY
jgi:hypothetical protein